MSEVPWTWFVMRSSGLVAVGPADGVGRCSG